MSIIDSQLLELYRQCCCFFRVVNKEGTFASLPPLSLRDSIARTVILFVWIKFSCHSKNKRSEPILIDPSFSWCMALKGGFGGIFGNHAVSPLKHLLFTLSYRELLNNRTQVLSNRKPGH